MAARSATGCAGERNYVLKTTAGEERRNLTREKAYRLALKRWLEWRDLGKDVEVTVYYQPTGQPVPQDRWLE